MSSHGARFPTSVALITQIIAVPQECFHCFPPHTPRVIDQIDRRCRRFLWRGNKNCMGGHCLVNWEKGIMTKNHARTIGIINLKIFSQSLLVKCWWRSFKEPHQSWRKLITNLHYQNKWSHACHTRINELKFASASWKGVLKVRHFFKQSVRFQCGNGKEISFWNDHWISNELLRCMLPGLFLLSSNLQISVAGFIDSTNTTEMFRDILNANGFKELEILDHLLRTIIRSKAS